MAVRIEAAPESIAPVPPVPGAPVRASPPYLLLADDDRAEGAALAALLHRETIACDVVHSEREALRAFQARDYDMLVMNLRGPVQAGLDAAMAIRKIERSMPEPRVPVYILADGASEKERSFAKEAGVDDVLERKKDVTDLAAIVESKFEMERRTPQELILREPLQYRKLLAESGGDDAAAMRLAEDFARLLAASIADVKTGIEAGDVDTVKRLAEAMRVDAVAHGSERTRRIGTLLARCSSPGQLKDRGVELLREFVDTARDLEAWRELGLGRVLFQARPVTATESSLPTVKRTVVKVYSFLKNREDVFSKA